VNKAPQERPGLRSFKWFLGKAVTKLKKKKPRKMDKIIFTDFSGGFGTKINRLALNSNL
jgi:hypothetical protein